LEPKSVTEHNTPVPHLPFGCSAVLFDMDDTLYQRREVFRGWAEAFASERFGDLDEAQLKAIVEYLVQLDDNGSTPRLDFFTTLRQKYPQIADSVEQLVAQYQVDYIARFSLDEEVAVLLHALREASIPFGIVTNGRTDQQMRKIKALGFDRMTSCLFISEQFGASKPDASIFHAAAACLQKEPQTVLFIGDNPVNDIWGAHGVGMHTIWMQVPESHWPTDIPENAADARVHTFRELLPLFGLSGSLQNL
jgi:putative hydrolase of the HAD superfamily